MLSKTIGELINCLPHLDHEKIFSDPSVDKNNLINYLVSKTDIPKEVSKAIILIVERIFLALSLLDSYSACEGKWIFVSYPAQLLAISILNILADNNQLLLDNDFWNSFDSNSIDCQRTLLKCVENRRFDKNLNGSPKPIRFIYVAWCIVKVGEYFLLNRRNYQDSTSDTTEYVMVGGGLNMNDVNNYLKLSNENIKQHRILSEIQKEQSKLAKNSLSVTIERKISIELSLKKNIHYSLHKSRILKPFRKVEGPGASIAFTEYYIKIFNMSLTPKGYEQLLIYTKENKDLKWFHIDEVVSGKICNKNINIFINALYDDFSNDKDMIKKYLHRIPESYIPNSHEEQIPKVINDTSGAVTKYDDDHDNKLVQKYSQATPPYTLDCVLKCIIDKNKITYKLDNRIFNLLKELLSHDPIEIIRSKAPKGRVVSAREAVRIFRPNIDIDKIDNKKLMQEIANLKTQMRRNLKVHGIKWQDLLLWKRKNKEFWRGPNWNMHKPLKNYSEIPLLFKENIE